MHTFGPYDTGGGKQVYGDPVRIFRRLLTGLGGDPDKWLARFDKLEDDEARQKVVNAAGWAFELVPFDRDTGAGATEDLVEHNLRCFLEWLEGEGLPAAISRTWSLHMEPASSQSEPPTHGSGSSSG